MKQPEKLYTTGEVAKMLSITHLTVKRWAEKKQIASIRTPGRRYLIPESEIKRLLEPLEKTSKKRKKK
ncbi:MAG: excisionase family DNA-binding protein [Candidatus Thermoplasmatota archaeon]